MRIVNEYLETLNELDVDLTIGNLSSQWIVKPDATPIDNITKFAWENSDYEEVQVYTVAEEDKPIYPQDDTDQLLIDIEYRLTLLELGLT